MTIKDWFKKPLNPFRVLNDCRGGCMAHYSVEEEYGTIIDVDYRKYSNYGETILFLIRWDNKEKEDQWMPKQMFHFSPEKGLWYRWY